VDSAFVDSAAVDSAFVDSAAVDSVLADSAGAAEDALPEPPHAAKEAIMPMAATTARNFFFITILLLFVYRISPILSIQEAPEGRPLKDRIEGLSGYRFLV
jgi:hypothetical protein